MTTRVKRIKRFKRNVPDWNYILRIYFLILKIILLLLNNSLGFTFPPLPSSSSSGNNNLGVVVSDRSGIKHGAGGVIHGDISDSTKLWCNRKGDNNDDYIYDEVDIDDVMARNDARLCVKSFLTQRSIQSFMYLLAECRDPHSGKWIEDFLGLQNLGNYHGIGAFNVTRYPTWDSVLLDMMRQPNEKMIVSAKRRGRGHGGWSKHNPYLEERYVEFPIDIRPASLIHRILSVRQQLAHEMMGDLEIVRKVDDRIMDSYFDCMKNDGNNHNSNHGRVHNHNAVKNGNNPTFERMSMQMMNNVTEFQDSQSSPLRRGNFDLLYNLCTQASIHRLLRTLQHDSFSSYPSSSDSMLSSTAVWGKDENEIIFRWLRRFYTRRVNAYFDGDVNFGRADDFMDELLRAPPSLIMNTNRGQYSDDGTDDIIGVVDPLRIAESLIKLRSEVALEWKNDMMEVADDHAKLNQLVFQVMMGKAMHHNEEKNDGFD